MSKTPGHEQVSSASEVCGLRLGDVDTLKGTVMVRGKKGHKRTLPLSEQGKRAVSAYVAHARLTPAWKPAVREAQDRLLLTERRHPLTKNGLTLLFVRLNQRAGLTTKPISMGLGTQRDLTRIGCGARTLRTRRARKTILLAKLSTNDIGSGLILLQRPFPARFAFRAGHGMSLPIDDKLAAVKTLPTARLPTPTPDNWTNQIDPIARLATHDMVSIHIASIYEVFRGKQVPPLQLLMDHPSQFNVLRCGWRGFGVHNEMRQVIITGLCQMHFVPSPDRTPLDTHACLRIVGRRNEGGSGRNVVIGTPMDLSCGYLASSNIIKGQTQ